jgi:hypothetical protein
MVETLIDLLTPGRTVGTYPFSSSPENGKSDSCIYDSGLIRKSKTSHIQIRYGIFYAMMITVGCGKLQGKLNLPKAEK